MALSRRILEGALRALQMLGQPDVMLDLHVYGGLVIAALGGWQISPPWTGVAFGLTLFGIGCWKGHVVTWPRGEGSG